MEMNAVSRKKASGFTVIEMFIALAVLAIVLAVALPSLENTAAKADMKAATDQVAQAFRTAKNAARLTSTRVTVTFTDNESGDNTISFAFANGTVDGEGTAYADNEGNAQRRMALPVIRLPAQIAVSGDQTEFTYDPLGMVDAMGTIALASTVEEQYASTVAITSTMGHVVAQYEHEEDQS
jgi:prepilin-type N-terminal cleavage/methylation domain-containing protein